MQTFLTDVTNVQFDGTFYTVPVQFCQLWTTSVAVGRHSLAAIHCLMTSKNQDLYSMILENLVINVPNVLPSASMSDREPAARNAFKQVHPNIKLYGCWFYFTHKICQTAYGNPVFTSCPNNPYLSLSSPAFT